MKSSRPFLLFPVLLIAVAHAGPGTNNPYGGRRALVIGIDGLRADALKQQVESGNAPNIAALVANGTVTWTGVAGGELGGPTQQPTISGPGWTSILTGMWTNRHNVVDNSTPAYNQPTVSGSYLVNQAPHFAQRLKEAAPATYFSSIASWSWVEDYLIAAQPGYLDFHTKGSGANYAARDLDVKNKAVAHLSSADPDVLFLHFDQVDGAGHSYGFSPSVANYMSAISAVDGLVGNVLSTIAARPSRASEQWMVVLTTDHGGTSGGSHGGQSVEERTIPFIVSGNGIPAGLSTATPGHAAVPATVIRYFGLGLPAAWNLAEDGFVTGATFTTQLNGTAVNLNWTMPAAGVPGLTGFDLRRNGTSIGTFPATQTSFSDPTPLPGSNNYELVLSGTAEASLKRTVLLPNPGEKIWDDANANNAWNTTDSNWTTGAIFGNGNDAIFSGATGEAVAVVGGGVSPATTTVSSGSYTFTGGSIGGTLAKGGGGSLTLSAANGFTATTVSGGPNSQTAGALQIGNFNALGSGPVSFAASASLTAFYFLPAAGSGTLSNDIVLASPATALTTRFLTDETNITATLGGLISGGSATHEILIDNDSGSNDVGKIRLTNSANSFTASQLRINRGGLVVTSDGALGNPNNDLFLDVTSSLANSGLVLEGNVNLGSGRSITVNSQTVIDTQATADSLGGPLTLTAQMVKRGSEALRLDAAGTGTGGVSLTEGSLTLGNAAGLGTGTLSVASTASAGFLSTVPLTGSVLVSNPIVLPNDSSATNRTVLMNGGSGQQLALSGVISGGGGNTTLYLNTSLTGDAEATFVLGGVNSFTGKTQLNRGSLTVNSNSSLGAAANALVMDANVGSKLSFSSGMTFTHPVTISTASVLDTAGNAVTFSSGISGGAAFTKDGTGELALTVANPHTGAVSVSAGTLRVDGTLAASANAVSVASAGTLSGAGTINRPLSVSGTLAPGNGVGTLSVPAAVSFGEEASYAFQLSNWSGAAGSGYDTLAASSVTIAATPAAKFTVKLDAAGLANFDGAPKSFVLASGSSPVSGLTAGNWAVITSGFAFSGNWSVQASGNDLLLVYSTASGFQAWAAAKGLAPADSGFTADPDHDGIANGLEYVLGTEPGLPSIAGLPAFAISGADFVFSFRLAGEAAYLAPVVEYSSSLNALSWIVAQNGQAGVSISSVPAGETAQMVNVTIPKNGESSLFARLRVSEPE